VQGTKIRGKRFRRALSIYYPKYQDTTHHGLRLGESFPVQVVSSKTAWFWRSYSRIVFSPSSSPTTTYRAQRKVATEMVSCLITCLKTSQGARKTLCATPTRAVSPKTSLNLKDDVEYYAVGEEPPRTVKTRRKDARTATPGEVDLYQGRLSPPPYSRPPPTKGTLTPNRLITSARADG
jgi:hypothetical protein